MAEPELESNPIARRAKLQIVLAGYQAFMSCDAFVHWKKSRQAEVSAIFDQIISCEPIDRKSEIEALKLRGDLRTNEDFLTIFEQTSSRLQATIDELIEAEQQTTKTNTK